MCSPGLEVEVELAAPLLLGRSVGDDDLDRVIVDLVGHAAQRWKKSRRSVRWAGSGSRTRTTKRLALHHGLFAVPGSQPTGTSTTPPEAPRLLSQVRGL